MTAFLWSVLCIVVFFVKQKTAYEMRISDWSSDVCSSDLLILIFSELVRWGFGDRPLYLDIPAALGGAVPLPGGGGYPAYRLAIIAVGLVTAVGLYLLIAKTRLGMQIRAGESDREMIGALGVDIRTRSEEHPSELQ